MKHIHYILSLAILPLLCAVASASHCGTVVVRANHVQNYGHVNHAAYANVVYPFQATTYVPVQVPTYSVGYGYDAASEVGKLRLELEIQKLRTEVQALRSSGFAPQVQPAQQSQSVQQQAPAMPQASNGNGGDLVNGLSKCAACHDSQAAKSKGGGFEMFQGGQTRKFSAEDSLNMLKQIETGKMPRGGAFTDGEKSAFRKWVAGA